MRVFTVLLLCGRWVIIPWQAVEEGVNFEEDGLHRIKLIANIGKLHLP
jgi:hypothetical protein